MKGMSKIMKDMHGTCEKSMPKGMPPKGMPAKKMPMKPMPKKDMK